MSLLSGFAIYFIIWWLVLFVVLPFRMRSQEEEGEVTLGTVSSAPAKPRLMMKFVVTTLVSAIVFAVYYWATERMGLTTLDIQNLYFPSD